MYSQNHAAKVIQKDARVFLSNREESTRQMKEEEKEDEYSDEDYDE